MTRACCCWCGGVVSAVRARGLPGGWPYLLQDVRVCLLKVVEGAEEASLDAGHVLLCEVGVVWVGVSGPGHSSTMRRACTMYGQSCRVVGRGRVGPLRFGGASLCWGRSVTVHATSPWGSPRSIGSTWRGNTSPYKGPGCRCGWRAACPRICVPRCPRCGGRPVRPPWRTCRGLGCVRGGCSRQGGGSRCRAPPSGQLVRGSGWPRGCSADCT